MSLMRATYVLAAILTIWFTLSGCPSGVTSSPPDASTKDVEPPEPTQPKVDLFAPDKILQIEIQLPLSDWDIIRKQTRNHDNFLAPVCGTGPWANPFTYKRATVIVNGEVRKNVGVRKKGFVGSIDENKPSLKIKFDEFVKGQELHGLDRMTLNNNRQDPAFVRQCLAYQIFAKVGLPAPRCNFAWVKINGHDLGIYAHIESVKKRFLARHFKDHSGDLYEGTLSDFRPEWLATFEPKTNKDAPDRSILTKMMVALQQSDDRLVAALSKWIDIDHFIKFWATEVLINHWDGYAGNTNNFYVYHDPTSKHLTFLPWGVDGTFQSRSHAPKGMPSWVFVSGILARRLYLYPETQKRYVAQLRALLDTVWKESDLLAELARMEKLLAPYAPKDYFTKARKRNFATAIQEVRSFIQGRRAQLKPVLDQPPTWNGPLRKMICFKIIGQIKGSFSTKFDTLKAPNPFDVGSGTFQATDADGKSIPITQNITATAGIDPKAPDWVIINVIAQTSATTFLVATFAVYRGEVVPNAKIQLRGPLSGGKSGLIEFNSATKKSKLLGLLWNGTLQLSNASTVPGQPLMGIFTAKFASQ